MPSNSPDGTFQHWIKSKLHDEFDHVAKEPMPDIIQNEIDKMLGEDIGKSIDKE